MPWNEVDIVKLRKQFIEEYLGQEFANFSALCNNYGISRRTGYKWHTRFMSGGLTLDRAGLVKPKKKRWSVPADEQAFAKSDQNNQVWGVNYKGQFKLGNGEMYYPLTIEEIDNDVWEVRYGFYKLGIIRGKDMKLERATQWHKKIMLEFRKVLPRPSV